MAKCTREQRGIEPMGDVVVRFMTVDDIDAIMVVEYDAFTVPWSRTAFRNELTANQFAHYLVLELDGKVIGYCGLWVIMDEAQITNIAIHSTHRGKKFGERLLQEAMEVARAYGAEVMTLEVRVTNTVAQNLYKKLGFQPGGIRKNYYSDNLEDALVMWVKLSEEG